MKERVFYVLNLDNRRIFTLAIFLVAMLFSFFFLGLSIGKKQGIMEAYKYDSIKPLSQNVAATTNPSASTPQEIIELKNQSNLPADKNASETIATLKDEEHPETFNKEEFSNHKNEPAQSEEPKLTTYGHKKKSTKKKRR